MQVNRPHKLKSTHFIKMDHPFEQETYMAKKDFGNTAVRVEIQSCNLLHIGKYCEMQAKQFVDIAEEATD